MRFSPFFTVLLVSLFLFSCSYSSYSFLFAQGKSVSVHVNVNGNSPRTHHNSLHSTHLESVLNEAVSRQAPSHNAPAHKRIEKTIKANKQQTPMKNTTEIIPPTKPQHAVVPLPHPRPISAPAKPIGTQRSGSVDLKTSNKGEFSRSVSQTLENQQEGWKFDSKVTKERTPAHPNPEGITAVEGKVVQSLNKDYNSVISGNVNQNTNEFGGSIGIESKDKTKMLDLNANQEQVGIRASYANPKFYDLKSNGVLSRNHKTGKMDFAGHAGLTVPGNEGINGLINLDGNTKGNEVSMEVGGITADERKRLSVKASQDKASLIGSYSHPMGLKVKGQIDRPYDNKLPAVGTVQGEIARPFLGRQAVLSGQVSTNGESAVEAGLRSNDNKRYLGVGMKSTPLSEKEYIRGEYQLNNPNIFLTGRVERDTHTGDVGAYGGLSWKFESEQN